MLGVIEATVQSDEEKNRLCPVVPYWDRDEDYLTAFLAMLTGNRSRAAHPVLARWTKATRLNPLSGLASHANDPHVSEAHERIGRFAPTAVANLGKLLSPARDEAATARAT
jgi:hypothetical protein